MQRYLITILLALSLTATALANPVNGNVLRSLELEDSVLTDKPSSRNG